MRIRLQGARVDVGRLSALRRHAGLVAPEVEARLIMLAGAEVVAFVSATDPARARRFYGEVLGLPCVDETPFACVFRTPNAELRVTFVRTLEPAPHTVVGWNVADVEASARDLRAKGVGPLIYDDLEQNALGIWRSPSGARVLWFADLDGNVLSLTQR